LKLELDQKQLILIKKCNYLYWRVTNIITNIPKNITHIVFQIDFNKDICQYLHSNIKYISFYNFNLPVGNLPDNLENVQFGSNFNQNVDYLSIFTFKY